MGSFRVSFGLVWCVLRVHSGLLRFSLGFVYGLSMVYLRLVWGLCRAGKVFSYGLLMDGLWFI